MHRLDISFCMGLVLCSEYGCSSCRALCGTGLEHRLMVNADQKAAESPCAGSKPIEPWF